MSTWWVNDTRKNRPLSSADARISGHSFVSHEWLSATGSVEEAPPGADPNWHNLSSAIQMHHAWTQTRDPDRPDLPEAGSVNEADIALEEITEAGRMAPVEEEGPEARVSMDELELRATRAELIISDVNA